MRYTKLRTWAILLILILGVILILTYSGGERGIYKSASPITDTLLTSSYPELYEAIALRDIQELEPFLSHQKQEVREQAWRALANTPVDSPSRLIELAKEQNSATAWFGISHLTLNEEQLRKLEQSWEEEARYRRGISRVLGVQGDAESLAFLSNRLDYGNRGNEYQFALAIGRLINRHKLDEEKQIGILQNAFEAETHEVTRAYLYGWYRGDESQLNSGARDTLYTRWQVLGAGVNPEVDQYVNKILPDRTTSEMALFYNGEQRLNSEIQLAVELAKSIGKIAVNDRSSLAAKILLTNSNPHVQTQTLQSLEGKISEGDELYNYISNSMLADSLLDDSVWLEAMHTAVKNNHSVIEEYEERLDRIAEENEYLLGDILAIYEQTQPAETFLKRIRNIVDEEVPLKTMHALQSLNRYWESLPNDEQTENAVTKVRNIIFQALNQRDRGIAFMAEPLLGKQTLFDSEDFTRINSTLLSFNLPEDIEVFQAFGTLYKDRFEPQAQSTIDSLAALGYGPLNRSLAEAGWEVTVSEDSHTEFRVPNWTRLWELGRNPVWTLRTAKGNISIELNTLSAPATVSMLDSLSRAGAYDGIPFHRVIPNFVIQGGDIERSDGFGGPDFVIPTEASEQEFTRGAIGIASAGSDTEGSQYFIMHQWKPHLNGDYTRFGQVVSGMNVVDQITTGDKVLSATWY
jgi:cyclophilin family peptidyl-prolyl cis-trans isomerase